MEDSKIIEAVKVMNVSGQLNKSNRLKRVRKTHHVEYLKNYLEPKYLSMLSPRCQKSYVNKTDEQKYAVLRKVQRLCELEKKKIAETVIVRREDVMSHMIERRVDINYPDEPYEKLYQWLQALEYYVKECRGFIELRVNEELENQKKELQQLLENFGCTQSVL